MGAALLVLSAAIITIRDLVSRQQFSVMIDLQIYRWGGKLARHSGDLYTGRFPHTEPYHLLFTYPPIAALIFAALSAIPLVVLDWLALVASIAALAGTLWLTWGALGYQRSAGRVAVTLTMAGLTLWLGPVQQTLSFGQINLILMLVIVADLGLPDTNRAKGIGVGLAAGFKLTPLIFVAYLLFTRRFRAAAVSLATFALTIVVSFVVLPTQSRRYWINGLFLNSHRAGSNEAVTNQSLNGALTRLTGSLATAHPYWLAASAVIGLGGLLLAARASRQGREMLGILTCALTGLLISPISWVHHWVWIAPALVVAADMAVRARAPGAGQLLSGEGSSPWRWAAWVGVAAIAVPFFFLPPALVPRGTIRDISRHPAPLLTGNLYVISGLVLLCLAGLIILRPPRVRLGPLPVPPGRVPHSAGARTPPA
jgi:alpha-1,2-mannosyltransferase